MVSAYKTLAPITNGLWRTHDEEIESFRITTCSVSKGENICIMMDTRKKKHVKVLLELPKWLREFVREERTEILIPQ